MFYCQAHQHHLGTLAPCVASRPGRCRHHDAISAVSTITPPISLIDHKRGHLVKEAADLPISSWHLCRSPPDLASARQRQCKHPGMVIPCASRPLRTWPVQYVECGVESNDEDLPSLDVGGARGAVYEVVEASDYEAENKNTGQEYGQYGLAACT